MLFVVLVCAPFTVHAAIDPIYKECLQRGYELQDGECVFPNGSGCSLEEFNDKQCGVEFLTEKYCVEEGEYVWDADRCCSGLKPYLARGVVGQQTCESQEDFSLFLPLVIIAGIVILVLLIVVVIVVFMRKRTSN